MIRDGGGALRLPSVNEKERIMGFDNGYVSRSFGPKMSDKEKQLVGGQMIGNAFNVHVVVMLLHALLQKYGVKGLRYHRRLVSSTGEAPAGWVDYPKFCKSSVETPEVAALVSHIMRHADRGGTWIYGPPIVSRLGHVQGFSPTCLNGRLSMDILGRAKLTLIV